MVEFIMESPNRDDTHKKRPRLVTSCDSCRIKKIKCLQPTPETECEACKAAKISCHFRDRARYFKERSRATTATSSFDGGQGMPADAQERGIGAYEQFHRSEGASGPDPLSFLLNSPNLLRSSSHSPPSNGATIPNFECHVRFQSYPPDSRNTLELNRRPNIPSSDVVVSGPGIGSTEHNYLPSGLAQLMQPVDNSIPLHADYSISLFDPDRPQSPNYNLMPHFIQLFFEQLGRQFPFLDYEGTLRQFLQETLPPLLSNCIAALAVRFSDLPELIRLDLRNVAEIYADNAKNIVSSNTVMSTIGTLHSLILLSWSEYKSRHIVGFRAYCQMAMKMALELGISEDQSIRLNSSEQERNMLHVTWSSLVQLYNTASTWHV